MVSARHNPMDSKILGKGMVQINFVTIEYAEKNAIKRPWGDIIYRGLQPKSKTEAIAQGFYTCMVRGPQPEDTDPSSLLWCRKDNLFKHNFQFAKVSAKKNKK